MVVTLAYLQGYVGRPLIGGESYRHTVGEFATWGWRDLLSGRRGWWVAVTLGDVVLELAWTIGGASQRNDELRRLVARRAQPAQVSA